MAYPKPPAVLEVIFTGNNVRPERVSISTLSRALSAINQLVDDRASSDDEEEESGVGPLQLLGVRRGSVAYSFAGQSPGVAVGRLKLAGQIIEKPDDIGSEDFLLSPIETLSSIARRLDCTIRIKQPGKSSPVLATIVPTSYKKISGSLLITGDTSIVGEVKGVGGATDVRCRIRVPFQERLLYCKVEGREVARKLGDCLYQDVVVQGSATWFKNTWRLMTMTIRSVQKPQPLPLEAAIKAIRAAGGNEWDSVGDVSAYLEEVTGQ